MYSGFGQRQKRAQAKLFTRFQEIDQVVGSSFELCCGWFGRTYVHVLIDLTAIGVDDLAAESLAQLNCQGRLSHCGGANYGDVGKG